MRETHTRQSVMQLGEEHGKQAFAPLERRNFETDDFFAAYMEGYRRGQPRLEPKPFDWADVTFAASGMMPFVYGSGIGWYDYEPARIMKFNV